MVFKVYRAMALLKFLSRSYWQTFRGSAQARPKQAMHVTSIIRISGHNHNIIIASYSWTFPPHLYQYWHLKADLCLLKEKYQLEDDLKVATSHQERERIQQRLRKVDENIQGSKSLLHHWEKEANRDGGGLKQLESTIREKGLFCVEWCLIVRISEYY